MVFKGEPTQAAFVTTQPIQVWVGSQAYQGLPVLVYNQDLVNTVYVGYNPQIQIGGINAVPLSPLTSINMDGSRTIWMAAKAGTANALVVPGGTNYIGSRNVVQPLSQQGSNSGAPAIAAMTPGTVYPIVSLIDVSNFQSYDINIYGFAITPGNVGSPIVMSVTLQWYDDLVSGIPVFEEDWWVWLGRSVLAAGLNTMGGAGPMHGRYFTVNVSIPSGCTTNATLQYINLFGSNRALPQSDWRQNAVAINPQINNWVTTVGSQSGTTFDNQLASLNSFPANSQQYFSPLGLYSGPVWFRFQAAVAATNNPTIVSMAGYYGGQLIPGTGTAQILANISADANEHELQFLAPRAPMVFTYRIASSSTTYSMSLTAQQGA